MRLGQIHGTVHRRKVHRGSPPPQRKRRLDVRNDIKYIAAYLVSDQSQAAKFGSNAEAETHALAIANEVARHDSAEDFSRLDALLCTAPWPGLSFPRIALPFHDRTCTTKC